MFSCIKLFNSILLLPLRNSKGSVVASMVMEFETSGSEDLSLENIRTALKQAVQAKTFGNELSIDVASITVQKYVGMLLCFLSVIDYHTIKSKIRLLKLLGIKIQYFEFS